MTDLLATIKAKVQYRDLIEVVRLMGYQKHSFISVRNMMSDGATLRLKATTKA